MLTILVPTAGQTTARDTAGYVMQVAKSLNARVLVIHVIEPGMSTEPGELSLEYFSKAGEENGIEVECCFRTGVVTEQIADFAEANKVNLIVMGASDGRIARDWISADVSRSTTIPVVVIPHQMFD